MRVRLCAQVKESSCDGVCVSLPPPPLWRRWLFPGLWLWAHLSACPPPPSVSASPLALAAGHDLLTHRKMGMWTKCTWTWFYVYDLCAYVSDMFLWYVSWPPSKVLLTSFFPMRQCVQTKTENLLLRCFLIQTKHEQYFSHLYWTGMAEISDMYTMSKPEQINPEVSHSHIPVMTRGLDKLAQQ